MSAISQDIEDALRELAEQPTPKPIERQAAQYPWAQQAIETQPTRLASHPPPLPPEVIAERLPTVVFVTNPAVAVAIEGGIAAAQQLRALQQRLAERDSILRRLNRDIQALKFNLLQLAPHAERAPTLKALISVSLNTCDLALAAVGER